MFHSCGNINEKLTFPNKILLLLMHSNVVAGSI